MAGGPQPRYVYWRRRLLALAAVIALIWVVVQVAGLFGDDSKDSESKKNSPSTSPPTESTDGPMTSAVSLAVDGTPCDPASISTLAWVPDGQQAGQPVTINLVFTNAGGAACTLNPDDAKLVMRITSNGQAVYDSSTCTTSPLDTLVVLSEDWSRQVPLVWNGRVSGAGCGDGEAFAGPGAYTVEVGTLGGEPSSVDFALADIAPTPAVESVQVPAADTSTIAAPDSNIYGSEASPALAG